MYKTDKDIMNRIKEHYKYLEDLGYEVVVIFLQGSQNYGLQDEQSDIDTKAIIVPSFEDFVKNKQPISTTYILDNNEHIDTKDIRIMCDMWIKQNLSYIELLYSNYYLINPKYNSKVEALMGYKSDIAYINPSLFLKCIKGMAYEKQKALCHPYPNTMDKIEKYGFDGKQLSHAMRLPFVLDNYINKKENLYTIKDILNKKMLINIKRNKNIKGDNYLKLDNAKEMMDKTVEDIKEKVDNYCEIYQNIINQNGIQILDNFKYEILSKKFKKDLTFN